MNRKQIIKELHISDSDLTYYIKLGLPYTHTRGVASYSLVDILAWLKQRKIKKVCTCGKTAIAKGLCRKCYDKQRRGK